MEFLNGLLRVSVKGAPTFNRIAEKLAAKEDPTKEEMGQMAEEEAAVPVKAKRVAMTKEAMIESIRAEKTLQE